jgi:hypothetical protein
VLFRSATRDSTIRLLYFSKTVSGNFQNARSSSIKSGFESVGLTAPDFKGMSRSDALAKIAEFETKLAGTNPKPAAATRLLPLLTDGLRDLKASQIPETWV